MPHALAQQDDQFRHVQMTDINGKTRTISTNLHLVYQIFKKLSNGYSPLIVICGSQRIGKSFVGNWLCYLFSSMTGKPFDPTKSTFYEPMEAIRDLEYKSRESLLIDEAGDILDVREWYYQSHQALKSIINTQGYKTMLYIFISPFTTDIDKAFRKHFDFQIRVDARGRMKTFRFVKKYDALYDKQAVYRRFLDDVGLPMSAIPTETWQKYLKYSIEEKEKIRKRRSKKSNRNKTFTKMQYVFNRDGINYGN